MGEDQGPGPRSRRRLGTVPGGAVIADLHLAPEGGARVDAFVAWLDGLLVPRLVILGDLFDSWIGAKQLRLPGSAPVMEALGRLVARGCELHVVPGNRDFLLGPDLERRTGGLVHAQGLVIEGPTCPTLLIHGDELCTLDLSYQRYKRVIQSPLAKSLLPRLPLFLLRRIAGGLRSKSERAVPAKAPEEKSMQDGAALAEAAAADVQALVCGHAHRFQDRELRADSEGAGGLRWLVLDGWGGSRDTLVEGADGWQACPHDELLERSTGPS